MSRRGPSNLERFALDSRAATATSTVASGPLYLHQVVVSLNDTNATGEIALSDVTATAGADFGVAARQILRIKLGAGGVSAAGGAPLMFSMDKPRYVARDVGVSATNAFVSIGFYPSN